MKYSALYSKDVAGAREEILGRIQGNLRDHNIIYYDGWSGFGAATVLRSIAQVLPSTKAPPPKLCFGRTIYIDCSKWTSKRAMQKKIAQELKLDHKTMAMIEEQDEEDDLNGVDLDSRDAIRSVAVVIDRILRESRFMMIFINGSQDELVLGRFGIPENCDCVILWTFSRRLVTMGDMDKSNKLAKKLRYTDIFLGGYFNAQYFSSSQFIALLREDAADIVARNPCLWGMDLTAVVDCCLYGLLMYHSFCSTTGFVWAAHAPNCWICDGIIQGDKTWEINNALNREISFDCDASVLDAVFKELKKDQKIPFLVVKDDDDVYGKRPYYRWISITLKNKNLHEDIMTNIVARASSIFLAFETQDVPSGLPNCLFKHSSDLLGVLVLSGCAFSFVSPPFLHCHTLRFLGLDHCRDNNATELERGDYTTKWPFLKSLWVIDLYYTDWVELLSEEKIDLMDTLMEVNIEGVRWPRWMTHQLQKRLPYLRQLRIVRPIYDEAETMSSDFVDSSFHMENTSLETLDLSGCLGLKDVVLSNNSSLRSFSFDGYGQASYHRTSTVGLPPKISHPEHPPTDADKKGVAAGTSMVSLEGCTRMEKLFLRDLPNLVELDLSGCAIKVLDFGAMVVDVPNLERLFLLGCEHLRAIKWGSEQMAQKLKMICIDTRPGTGRVLGFAQRKFLGKQVHAVTADARLARCLWAPITLALMPFFNDPCYFKIRITSSSATCTTGVFQPTAVEVSGGLLYNDVFTKVGDGQAPWQALPQAPARRSNGHVEIGDGSRNVQSEVEAGPYANNLATIMLHDTQSLYVHDVSTSGPTMPGGHWHSLRWCRIERCPNLHAVFPLGSEENGKLETIWASDLLMARCIWSRGSISYAGDRFKGLQHLHLHRCPSLRFALAMGWSSSFPSLETLHIIHCGDLRHIFVHNENQQHRSVEFPSLTTIHLHDLPSLQQICEATDMLAPALETIRIRGCPNLRRLPALKGRRTGPIVELEEDVLETMEIRGRPNLHRLPVFEGWELGKIRRPTVEMEKDVWDALEWDGMDAGHHPSLYKAPVHPRYYKRRLLRRTVLRFFSGSGSQ